VQTTDVLPHSVQDVQFLRMIWFSKSFKHN